MSVTLTDIKHIKLLSTYQDFKQYLQKSLRFTSGKNLSLQCIVIPINQFAHRFKTFMDEINVHQWEAWVAGGSVGDGIVLKLSWMK